MSKACAAAGNADSEAKASFMKIVIRFSPWVAEEAQKAEATRDALAVFGLDVALEPVVTIQVLKCGEQFLRFENGLLVAVS